MHLDTVITQCDRDLVTLFPEVVYGARTWAIRPGDSAEHLVSEEQHGTLPELMAKALGVGKMRVIETGGGKLEGGGGEGGGGEKRGAAEPRGGGGHERSTRTNNPPRAGAARGLTHHEVG